MELTYPSCSPLNHGPGCHRPAERCSQRARISWGLVGESIRENDTVENIARLFSAALDHDFGVFISPHYLYPHDQKWQYGGTVEHMMLDGKEFFRPDPLGRKDSPVPVQIGLIATSRSLKTAGRWW